MTNDPGARRLAHLVRTGATVADDVVTTFDLRLHVGLDESGRPVYVRDGQPVDGSHVIDLIFEADSVVVW